MIDTRLFSPAKSLPDWFSKRLDSAAQEVAAMNREQLAGPQVVHSILLRLGVKPITISADGQDFGEHRSGGRAGTPQTVSMRAELHFRYDGDHSLLEMDPEVAGADAIRGTFQFPASYERDQPKRITIFRDFATDVDVDEVRQWFDAQREALSQVIAEVNDLAEQYNAKLRTELVDGLAKRRQRLDHIAEQQRQLGAGSS